MKKMLTIAVLLAFVLTACKKDKKDDGVAVDPRDKFVGTWTGNYTFNLTGLPPGTPNVLPTSIVISKSQTSPTELQIKIINQFFNNQTATAVVSGNQYIYKPLSVTIPIALTLNGTGLLSSDGKSINESGTASGSYQIPGSSAVPISGTWTSALTKQ
jgi:hypothetical protein